MQTHPQEFFVVHALLTFQRNHRSVTQWGSLSDGPYDRTEALDCISDHFREEAPTLENLRVFHFQDDVPARDVTEDILAEVEARLNPELSDEEYAEQYACDRADEWVKLQREGEAA